MQHTQEVANDVAGKLSRDMACVTLAFWTLRCLCCSHYVRRAPYVDALTWTYDAYTSTYVNVRRRKSTQDTADSNYMLLC